MLWPAIRSAIYAGLGALEAGAAVYDRAKRIGRKLLPRKREDSMPLSHRDSERIAEFGRRAGHETEARPKARPPSR